MSGSLPQAEDPIGCSHPIRLSGFSWRQQPPDEPSVSVPKPGDDLRAGASIPAAIVGVRGGILHRRVNTEKTKAQESPRHAGHGKIGV